MVLRKTEDSMMDSNFAALQQLHSSLRVLVSYTFDITMAVFDVGDHIVTNIRMFNTAFMRLYRETPGGYRKRVRRRQDERNH